MISSFPAMGTWIEIGIDSANVRVYIGRSLQWERGLKYISIKILKIGQGSFPAMGTWIEI